MSNRRIIVNPQVYGYAGDVSYFPKNKIAVVAFCTDGPKRVLSEQDGTASLLRIAADIDARLDPGHPSAGGVA